MSWMVSNSFITFQMPTINHIAPFFLLFKDVNLCTVLLQWISFSIWCMCVYIFLLSSWFNSIYQNLSLISVKCTLSSRSLCWRAWIVHSSFQFNSISLLCVWVREYKKKTLKFHSKRERNPYAWIISLVCCLGCDFFLLHMFMCI